MYRRACLLLAGLCVCAAGQDNTPKCQSVQDLVTLLPGKPFKVALHSHRGTQRHQADPWCNCRHKLNSGPAEGCPPCDAIRPQ